MFTTTSSPKYDITNYCFHILIDPLIGWICALQLIFVLKSDLFGSQYKTTRTTIWYVGQARCNDYCKYFCPTKYFLSWAGAWWGHGGQCYWPRHPPWHLDTRGHGGPYSDQDNRFRRATVCVSVCLSVCIQTVKFLSRHLFQLWLLSHPEPFPIHYNQATSFHAVFNFPASDRFLRSHNLTFSLSFFLFFYSILKA